MANTPQEAQIESIISNAICRNKTDIKQLIASVLTIVTLAVGVVLWATNAHADIKDWTASQDYVTKEELKEIIKEQYVPKIEFVIVKEKLDNLNEKHDTLMNTLNDMNKKLDSLERGAKYKR